MDLDTTTMTDNIFRTKQESTPTEVKESSMKEGTTDTVSQISVEPPFTDYQTAHTDPFTVEYYDLGKYWNTDEIYTKEVGVIEDFLRLKISRGEIDNSLEAVKEYMKRIERTAGVEKTDSTVVKVGKVSAYTEFMTKVNSLKGNAGHYANS